MYDDILNSIAYTVLFDEYGVLNEHFWFGGVAFLSEFFFAFWGVRIGANFFKHTVFNLW